MRGNIASLASDAMFCGGASMNHLIFSVVR